MQLNENNCFFITNDFIVKENHDKKNQIWIEICTPYI